MAISASDAPAALFGLDLIADRASFFLTVPDAAHGRPITVLGAGVERFPQTGAVMRDQSGKRPRGYGHANDSCAPGG